MKKKKKNTKTTIDLYERNLQHLMDISKYIDEDNIYPPETQSNSIFIKLLFQDIRKCSKWYEHDEWRLIKTAIHNCYKLLQNGYVPENQSELGNNIKILEILLKESNYKKSNVDKITEEVMQNIFDKTLKNLNEMNEKNNSNNNNININKISEEDKNNNNYINNKNEFVTKENMDKIINEQKMIYENKINLMQSDIDELKNKVNELSNLINNIGKCFTNIKTDDDNKINNKK